MHQNDHHSAVPVI